MTHKEAVNFVRAAKTIAEILDTTPEDVLGALRLIPDSDIIEAAAALYNEFLDADIEERGRMFGYEVTVTEDGSHEISTES